MQFLLFYKRTKDQPTFHIIKMPELQSTPHTVGGHLALREGSRKIVYENRIMYLSDMEEEAILGQLVLGELLVIVVEF